MPIMASSAKIDEAVRAHIQGRIQQAEELYKSVLNAVPNHPQASQFLGVLVFQNGRKEEGIRWMEQGVRSNPGDPEAWSNLGNAYRVVGRGKEAIEAIQRALSIAPTFAPAYCTLSACLREVGTLGQAIDAARNAIRLQPNLAQAHNNLGLALLEAGESNAAIAALQQALYVSPQFLEAHQGLLFAMHYSDKHSAHSIMKQAQVFASTQPRDVWPVEGDLKTIGFLSGDFRNHPVAFFLEPMLRKIDKSKFKVVLLSNTCMTDEVTERLKLVADEFIDVTEMAPLQLQKACRALVIDMVIDLAGHTASNRIDALAQRIAPVQVSWLGYSGTTGLPSMDWILVDSEIAPPGTLGFTEWVSHLPDSVFCFDPGNLKGTVQPPPCFASNQVTFGSFNNLSKISPSCVALWSQVLLEVSDSRLILKSRHLEERGVADRLIGQFQSHGVSADRIITRGWTLSQCPIDDYNEVDVALDTFPYSGATTTIEALGMGVPVVTLVGDTYASRMSRSILSAVGREEWITDTPEKYVSTAIELANCPSRLEYVRRSLRNEVFESPLCDPGQFAKNFESNLESIWNQTKKNRNVL